MGGTRKKISQNRVETLERAECWQEIDLEEKVVHFTKYYQNRLKISEDYRQARMWVSSIFHSEISVSIWLERAFIHQLLMAVFPFGRKEKKNLSRHSIGCWGLY